MISGICPRGWRAASRLGHLATLIAGVFGSVVLAAAPAALKVVGSQLLYENGQPARLRGVNCAGLEWSIDADGRMPRTLEVAIREWHANLIRLPVSQDRWFGRAPGQTDGGAAYRALVRRLADYCAANNAYLMLDLHWSDAGQWGRHIGQHNLPDKNSVVFWQDAAPAFKDNPAVLFDLYNEPSRIDWDQWYGGGPMTEIEEKTGERLKYDAIGLATLVTAIRATGAKNVIVAGGINWAYEVEGIPGERELHDPTGNGIIYAVHPYPHAYARIGRETIAQWVARMEPFARRFPIIVSEFGALESSWPFPKEWNMNDEKWNREMLATLEAHGWNWTAWDFHVSAAPCLIADWDFTPTPHFGVWVKQALAENLKP